MKTQQSNAMLPGISSIITATNELLRAAALNDSPVFITGELGTEKAFAAKLIHQNSVRAPFPLTRINVSWKLPPDLGSYFAQTNGGTLLIHLQKEFPIDMQYSLVEMATEGFFADPITGEEASADVRIIIMTSLDLETIGGSTPILPELRELLVEQHIEIPALRDRTEDIPAIVRYAINRARDTGKATAKSADPQVISLFRQFHWPGNAEDLLLVTAQAAITAKSEVITLDDLPENFMKQFAPEIITRARTVGGNTTGGITRADDTEQTKTDAFSRQRGSSASMPMLYALGQPTSPPAQDFKSMKPVAPPPATQRTEDTGDQAARETQELAAPRKPATPFRPDTDFDIDETHQLTPARGSAHADDTQPVIKPSDPYRTPVPTDVYALRTPAEGTSRPENDTKEVLPRVLNLARRLNSQSKILGKQISGPLAADSTGNHPGMQNLVPTSDTEALKSLEKEIDRGLDLVMSLRRQMAMLNMRHVESAETIRDLMQRLTYSSDTITPVPVDSYEVSQDAKMLTENLQTIDDIIKRVSTEVPMLTKQVESTAAGNPSAEEDTQKPFYYRKDS
ncbi:sigma 54-interacting transcriptional regulator [Candidatus Sumerlaeota bacterium]|nr:sigma 54-interacting transcriptional regulator [Candidatus Sumerlaeota bacterium]